MKLYLVERNRRGAGYSSAIQETLNKYNREINPEFQRESGRSQKKAFELGKFKTGPKSIELSSDDSDEEFERNLQQNLRSKDERHKPKTQNNARYNLDVTKNHHVPSTISRFNQIIHKYSENKDSNDFKRGRSLSPGFILGKKPSSSPFGEKSKKLSRRHSDDQASFRSQNKGKLIPELTGQKRLKSFESIGLSRADYQRAIFNQRSASNQRTRSNESDLFVGMSDWVPQGSKMNHEKKLSKKSKKKLLKKAGDTVQLTTLDGSSSSEDNEEGSFGKDVPARITNHKFIYPLEGRFIDNLLFQVEWKPRKNGKIVMPGYKSRKQVKSLCPELLVEYYENYMDYNLAS